MTRLLRALVLLAVMAGTGVTFAQGVGRVQFVAGDAQVERATQRSALQVGSELRRGDLVVTGADGHVQARMVDAAHVSIRPRSRLRIDEYEFDTARPNNAKAMLLLLTGVIHAFTGEISQQRRERFQMRTPLASIGIRGSGNILAHLEETGTINHTLTGAHSVTSLVQGVERTLISYPGQTIQVRAGLPPRYIPTPPLIMAAAAPASRAESASRAASDSAAAPAAAAPVASGSSSSTGGSGTEASGGTSSSTATASSPPAGGDTASASTTPLPAGGVGAVTGGDSASASTSTTSPLTAGSAPSGTSQATTATVGAAIAAAQPPPALAYETVLRFFRPLGPAAYEGVLGSASSNEGSVVSLDAAGRLVQVTQAVVGTFLGGPGAVPTGYVEANYAGTVSFANGAHHDAFRNSDGSVILGRWSGGSVIVTDASGARTTMDLGPRSASYDITSPTPSAVIGAFTGTATYSLAAATAPTDAAGNIGTLTSATVNANFGTRTVSGNIALNVNGANYALAGTSDLAPGNPRFTFASSLATLNINCTGSCASNGYLGTVNGLFAGPAGQWLGMSYRINPDRAAGAGYNDFVVGSLALTSGSAPAMAAAARRGR